MRKEEIRKTGLSLGADVVGFADIKDYQSKRAPDPKTILPEIRSMVVMGFRELDGPLASEIGRISMHGRIGQMDLTRSCTFRMAKALEDRYRVKAAPILASYPLNMAAPALLRLQALDVEAEVKERIAWRNAAEMRGLVDGLA